MLQLLLGLPTNLQWCGCAITHSPWGDQTNLETLCTSHPGQKMFFALPGPGSEDHVWMWFCVRRIAPLSSCPHEGDCTIEEGCQSSSQIHQWYNVGSVKCAISFIIEMWVYRTHHTQAQWRTLPDNPGIHWLTVSITTESRVNDLTCVTSIISAIHFGDRIVHTTTFASD